MGRDWNNHKLLYLHLAPEVFDTWRIRALGYLAKDRPDVRHILVWAESQSEEIVGESPQKGVADPTPQWTTPEILGTVNHTLFEAINGIVVDALLERGKLCLGSGLDLWRKLTR